MDSITSTEADQYEGVKELVEAFDPWPLQVEKAWYIAREHIQIAHLAGEQLATRVYRREAMEHLDSLNKSEKHIEEVLLPQQKKADKLVQTLMERNERVRRFISSITDRDSRLDAVLDEIEDILKGEE